MDTRGLVVHGGTATKLLIRTPVAHHSSSRREERTAPARGILRWVHVDFLCRGALPQRLRIFGIVCWASFTARH